MFPNETDGPYTHVGKNGRVYQRKFDWDYAQLRRDQGWTYKMIADHVGVTEHAIYLALNEEGRAKQTERGYKWIRENKRLPCKGGCGKLVWMQNKGRTGYCAKCWGHLRAADNIRPDELRCLGPCGEWKPDDEFPKGAGKTDGARRGRRSLCKQCDNAKRQGNREKNRERERAYDRARYRQRRKKAGRVDSAAIDNGGTADDS